MCLEIGLWNEVQAIAGDKVLLGSWRNLCVFQCRRRSDEEEDEDGGESRMLFKAHEAGVDRAWGTGRGWSQPECDEERQD